MKINKITYLIILLTLMCFAFVKQEKDKPHTIKAKLDYISVDNLGNVYIINGDELIKYSSTAKFFARYSNLKLGTISSVDATNPLKVVLYYRDFQQILFLDNQLSINSEQVSLEKLGYEQTELVCASANNSFWIYDKQNNELLRFNENSKKIANTGNLKQILQTDITPNFMTEYNGFLYLNCPSNGIYVFDIFGAFSKLISLKNLKQFQVSENLIYYQKDSAFCSYDYKLFDETCKTFSGSSTPVEMKYSNHKIYKAYKDSVTWISLSN